jgi:hypothetical protein
VMREGAGSEVNISLVLFLCRQLRQDNISLSLCGTFYSLCVQCTCVGSPLSGYVIVINKQTRSVK